MMKATKEGQEKEKLTKEVGVEIVLATDPDGKEPKRKDGIHEE